MESNAKYCPECHRPYPPKEKSIIIMYPVDKALVTVRKASQLIGASQGFLRTLIRKKMLTKYTVNTAVYVSLREFEQIADPMYKLPES